MAPPAETAIDLARVGELVLAHCLRFTEGRDFVDGMDAVRAVIRARDVDALARALAPPGEPALFAAIALGALRDARGLALLRDPHAHFCTNSCFELGLALCARLVLGDVDAPLRFINAQMLGELAEIVGAFRPRR